MAREYTYEISVNNGAPVIKFAWNAAVRLIPALVGKAGVPGVRYSRVGDVSSRGDDGRHASCLSVWRNPQRLHPDVVVTVKRVSVR